MVNRPASSMICSRPREPLAIEQGEARASGAPAAGLADQAAVRCASDPRTQNCPDFVFAFHDDEELGPRMLARIAKHTGLKPQDL